MTACDICEIANYCEEGGFPNILEPLAACSYSNSTDYEQALVMIKEVREKFPE